MPTSDEELQAQRDRVDKLRERVAAERVKAVDNTASVQNDVDAALLSAEEARLEAELAAVKQTSTKSAAKEAAARPLEQAKEQMEEAVAAQKAAEQAASGKDK